MALATATKLDRSPAPAALFECANCDGWHLANGFPASPFQVHRLNSRYGMLVCDGCATMRPILREGEAIPVKVGRWPDLPPGLRISAADVLV